MTVERFQESDGRWVVYRTDNDWDTRFRWHATGATVLGWNLATLEWDVGVDVDRTLLTIAFSTFGHQLVSYFY